VELVCKICKDWLVDWLINIKNWIEYVIFFQISHGKRKQIILTKIETFANIYNSALVYNNCILIYITEVE
jgi:hypothetical protein